MTFCIEEACDDLMNHTSESAFLFIEGASETVSESFLNRIMNKCIEIKNKIQAWISNFFTKVFTKNTEDKIKEAIAENPELKNAQVQVHDYQKVSSLQNEIVNAIEESKEIDRVKAKMKKYKKQRNKLIATAAVITVSLGSALFLLNKKKNGKIETLDNANKKLSASIESYKETIKEKDKIITKKKETIKKNNDTYVQSLKNQKENYERIIGKKNEQIEYLKANSPAKRAAVKTKGTANNIKNAASDGVSNMKTAAKNAVPTIKTPETVQLAQAKASAISEVIGDIAKDTKDNITELAGVVSNPKKSTLSKVSAVKKTVSKTVADTVSTATGKSSEKHTMRKNVDNAEKIAKLQNYLTKGKAAYKKLPDGEKKTELRKKLIDVKKQLEKLQTS